ncbi:MAG: PAC2 family protein [Candidatus Tectomicrobia bacterium]|uniref:PAC2 family protein n=1 Tax=Tectimicrobiota bacterium TaxID=2528274 RepID=A0A938B3K6_UNCTE|nr:PAC2 family protein [Candidatus Tectomicrobia bacterium]
MPTITFHRALPSTVPMMVMAFGGWINAGEAATSTMKHLVQHLAASRLASWDAEEFFVLTQNRPTVRLDAEGIRELQWPQSDLHVWEPADGRAGLLLFSSMEPHLQWRTFTKELLDVAEQCGVHRIISIGALLAEQPHTRPARVTGRSTDPAWQALVERWGIYRPSRYQGPTGISTVVLEAAAKRGMTHLSFMGQAPHYLQGTANPDVIQALLTMLNRVLDVDVNVSQFDEAIKRFRAECDQAVKRNTALQDHIQELEQAYDAASDTPQRAPQDDEEPNPARLIQEIENFLREGREGGSRPLN